jgi:hypothetical protein
MRITEDILDLGLNNYLAAAVCIGPIAVQNFEREKLLFVC